MNQKEKNEYAAARLERAKQILDDAGLLIENGSILSANNRIYYAVFNAICAVLIFKDLVNKNHSQAIGSFNKLIINSGIMDLRFRPWMGRSRAGDCSRPGRGMAAMA